MKVRLTKAVSTPTTRHVSEPVAIDRERFAAGGCRVHTGDTGTLVPVSRDHLETRNERARTVRDRSCPVDFVISAAYQ